MFLNGTEKIVSANHTTIATTNVDPSAATKANKELKAVVDRFLFKSQVTSLDSDQEYLQMLTTYLSGLWPFTTIPYADLHQFSDIVVDTNLVTNPTLIAAYVNAVNAYRKQASVFISDRTLARMTQILEAQALLFNRTEIIPEDILAVGYGLVDGEDKAGRETFETAAMPAIKTAEKELGADIDEAQRTLLQEYAAQIPSLRSDTVSAMSANDLIDAARVLS